MDKFREAVRDIVNGSLLFVAGIGNTLVRGLLISILWNWFVAPAFNIPHIGILSGVGMSFLFGLFTSDLRLDIAMLQDKPKEQDDITRWGLLLGELLGYGISLLFAFGFHLFQ